MRWFAAFAASIGFCAAIGTTAAHGSTPDGTLQFASETIYAEEGQGYVTVRVERGGALVVGKSFVDYGTVAKSSTAAPGTDYAETSGTLVFDTGDIAKYFTVAVRDDRDDEPAEEVVVALSNPRGQSSEAGGPAAIVIIDDDFAAPTRVPPPVGAPSATSGSVTNHPPPASEPRATSIRRTSPRRSQAQRAVLPRAATPFELRGPVARRDPGSSTTEGVEPFWAIVAALVLARVSAELWFRTRVDPAG